MTDHYPRGDPKGLNLDELMKGFIDKNITYYFGYIKKFSTDTMVKAFNASMKSQSTNTHSIQEFDASDPSKLLEGVFKSVTCSITATVSALMLGERPRHDYSIDKQIPNWDYLPSQVVMVTPPPPVGSAPKIAVPSTPMNIKIAPQPFDEGAQKIAYHAFNEDTQDHIVLKRLKWADARSSSIKRCIETAQIHAIAANYSAEFNRENQFRSDASQMQFVPVGVMEVKAESTSNPKYFTYEPYLGDGGYTKFNTNFHYIQTDDDEFSATCQAFSHYTWQKSGNQQLMCDLQGVKMRSKVVLTDPVIHCTNVLWHGSTNFGTKGIQQFFRTHKCNHLCEAMKLKRPSDI